MKLTHIYIDAADEIGFDNQRDEWLKATLERDGSVTIDKFGEVELTPAHALLLAERLRGWAQGAKA